MIKQGHIISYLEMCQEEGVNLQRGMNFRLRGSYSVILMSLRKGAPYADRVEDDGKTLIYEGHDVAKRSEVVDPKKINQPMKHSSGKLTQNGLFYEAAQKYKESSSKAEPVKVYEKIRDGIWVYNGIFKLTDSWEEQSGSRTVFKFRLEIVDKESSEISPKMHDLFHNRLIPTSVKLEVWKRDKGKCVICGKKDNLHFDHILPFSKGGTSLKSENIQILCARHNLEKRDKIE